MNPPKEPTRPPIVRDDGAIAGAVGGVLLLALLVTVYAHTVLTSIPMYGAEAEREWDEGVADAFSRISQSVADVTSPHAPVVATIPAPTQPQGVDFPLLGTAYPAPPTGSLSYRPSCTTLRSNHSLWNGNPVEDITQHSSGCLHFMATPAYSEAVQYRFESAGVLRVQGDRAVVVHGPPIEMAHVTAGLSRFQLTLVSLEGDSATVAGVDSPARVELTPVAHAREQATRANAASGSVSIATHYPEAWHAWFKMAFERAGWVEGGTEAAPGNYSLTCDPAPCQNSLSMQTLVRVRVFGPSMSTGARDPGAPPENDLLFSISHLVYRVSLR